MKRLFVMTLGTILLILLSACGNDEIVEYQYVSLVMNPKIDMFLDQEGSITHYAPLNEDAEILLADIDLQGLALENALGLIIDTAVETGYIDILTDENVIALFAESTANPGYQEEVKEILEDHLSAIEVGCVVIDQQSVRLAELRTIEGNQLSRFMGKMYDLYSDFNSTQIENDFFDQSTSDVIKFVQNAFDETLLDFQQLREASMLTIKNAYIDDLALLIDYFRQGVAAGVISQPDLTSALALFLNQYVTEINKINQRNQDRATYIQNKSQNDLSELLDGQFEASVFIGNFPYTLNYYRITFYETGTYAESWSITADGQTQTSDYIGSYQVVDGELNMSYPGNPLFNMFISKGKICGYDQDGNLLVFHEVSTT